MIFTQSAQIYPKACRNFFDYRRNLSFELEREVREKGDIFNVNFEFDDI